MCIYSSTSGSGAAILCQVAPLIVSQHTLTLIPGNTGFAQGHNDNKNTIINFREQVSTGENSLQWNKCGSSAPSVNRHPKQQQQHDDIAQVEMTAKLFSDSIVFHIFIFSLV